MDWPCLRRGLLHEIIEGRMRGKATRGRRRIQMLHVLANDDGYVEPASVAQLAENQCTPIGTVCRRSRGSIPLVDR